MGSPEESPATEAADAAVVRVMDFARWGLLATDWADSVVGNFWNIFV